MDPDFQRALLVVVVVGTLMIAIGVAALVLFFRGFGAKGAGKARHMALMVGLIVFVMLCCFMLFWFAFASGH